MAHVGLVVLVIILVGMVSLHVVSPSGLAQAGCLEFSLGYAPSEVVSIARGCLGEYTLQFSGVPLFACTLTW